MKTSEKIIAYMLELETVSTESLVDYLGIGERAVRKQIKNLLDNGTVVKIGKAPKVYYTLSSAEKSSTNSGQALVKEQNKLEEDTLKIINDNYFNITPRGNIEVGFSGFVNWCVSRNLNISNSANQYIQIFNKYKKIKKNGLIDGMLKMKSTFDDVALDHVFYIDFYSVEIFGKTRLGQLLLFAKQSQNRKLINVISDEIKDKISTLIEEYSIDAVGFIPPTVKRELQIMKQLEKRLNLNIKTLKLVKLKTEVAVPQKTLKKLEDRIINARETIYLDDKGNYKNILLIDDAVGSGATLNELAKKIRKNKLCSGKIIGLAITGSLNGFDVINEV